MAFNSCWISRERRAKSFAASSSDWACWRASSSSWKCFSVAARLEGAASRVWIAWDKLSSNGLEESEGGRGFFSFSPRGSYSSLGRSWSRSQSWSSFWAFLESFDRDWKKRKKNMKIDYIKTTSKTRKQKRIYVMCFTKLFITPLIKALEACNHVKKTLRCM